MRRQRKDQYVCSIAGPQSDVNTETTDDELVQEVVATSVDTIQVATLDNPQQTAEDGALRQITGLWYDQINVPLEAFQEGLRAVAADTDPAVLTAMCHLLGGVFQQVPTLFKRSKVLGSPSPTTTAFAESVNDGHKPAGGYGSTQMGLVLCRRAGPPVTYHWRMFTYTAASDLFGLTMALPNALAADDILYAAANFQFCEKWDALPYPLTVNFFGNDEEQNAKLIGAVGSLSVANVAPGESPKFAFSLKAALGERDITASRPSTSYQTPLCLAGSALTIGAYGSTVAHELCADVEINIGTNWSPMTCRNLPSGLQNWKRGKGNVEVRATLPHHIVPSDLKGGGASSWRAALAGSADQLWQFQAAYGQQVPGSAACFGFPCMRLVGVSGGEREEDDARVLTFRPAAEYVGILPSVIGGLS